MEMEDGGGAAVALKDCGIMVALEVALVSCLRLQWQRLAAVAVEEHAMMMLASASSKPRIHFTTLALALVRTAREDVSNVRDICWHQWQQNRHIAVVVMVAAVRIQ
jgi:hypothetical protein